MAGHKIAQPPAGNGGVERWEDIPSGAIPKQEEGLAKARQAAPIIPKEIYLDAPPLIADFFLRHPMLAFKISRHILGDASLKLEQDEETGEWIAKSQSVKLYIIPLQGEKKRGLAAFRFALPVPLVSNAWVSGHGFFTLHAEPGSGVEETVIRQSLRMATGKDYGQLQGAATAYVQSALAGQAQAIIESFIALCEETADDAESIAEDMESDEEIFSAEEISLFRRELQFPAGR